MADGLTGPVSQSSVVTPTQPLGVIASNVIIIIVGALGLDAHVIPEPDSSQARALELWKASNQIKPQATALSYRTHGITQQTKPSNPQKNNFRQEENCREKIG
ncbi:hypothetical protein ElyMa_000080100 [Elysia marginata]|uniref:Uncharacterized protein n=1 Tax=Elysia marginata TaxID=1093978 RepID=A0AAV4EID6_9GAST|nr:hypothetical protein ElyMa_000080100 [Elysia marginata]